MSSDTPGPKGFRTRADFRSWLVKNEGRNNGLWVLIKKVGGNRGGILYTDAVEEALCAGWIDGKMKSLDQHTYKLWFSPRRPGSIWSKLNRERAEKLVKAGLVTSRGLAAIEEAKRNGNWLSAYSSKEPPKLPAELASALQEDPEAWANFEKLANSYKTQYSGWVAEAKRVETKKRRISVVVSRVKENKKPGIDM